MVSCQVAEAGGERTVDNFAAVVPRGQAAFASSSTLEPVSRAPPYVLGEHNIKEPDAQSRRE